MRGQNRREPRSKSRRHGTRRPVLSAVVAATIGAMTLGALALPAASAARPDAVQRSLNALVRDSGTPGALASVRGREGRDLTYTAGIGDLATGAPVPVDGQVRIGSNTKSFVAVVVLQLVAERRVSLEDSVDTHLPGLVRGEGIDGRHIKIRHLLQHTSGLPEYSSHLGDDVRYYAPRELLATALRHPAEFAPGKSWKYSNTNYVLAGLIVQKITAHPLADEIDRRVIKRLGLRHTYFPAPGDASVKGPHPHGYYRESAKTPLRDVTEIDPSWGWAAGQLISTNSDLNRFFTALLAGRLLPSTQLAQMRATVPAEATFGPGARYGLGLVSRPLRCGGLSWGHGGSFPGYETRGGVTDDGRAANIAVTTQLTGAAPRRSLERAVDAALCR
ncbi:serine hydrolase [Streptomyces alfalfae]|uniref:Beta-lactamase family protein n=1 Tax=Streptomyces alfalfae TaxID=1642299 RepID=A0A1P8TIK5_9ACTN|nr:serine hydrolase domain-containing protein [Streptomyces alfalfae]AYA17890.1 class A beta-lactamase-related serine hydrolase [Streptomyces fradiae]APY87477.1 serine hydrolase [Streptomyces alfalfae]QQC90197.1 beta-lactamase family protein [Streptomyces alfalfae]RXX45101.1 serine hydrolase [Streptomyces alfalfae]RZM99089.1 class A beta-lactamase-related serine hydrolase [Streptomyces alfalfae]